MSLCIPVSLDRQPIYMYHVLQIDENSLPPFHLRLLQPQSFLKILLKNNNTYCDTSAETLIRRFKALKKKLVLLIISFLILYILFVKLF